MSRRRLSQTLICAVLGATTLLVGCSPRGADGPSGSAVLVLTIDTLRADRLGCSGAPGARSPHLDRLARSGVQFPVAVTSVPLTLPSHTTLFSGLQPPDHGVRNNGFFEVPAGIPLIAEAFSANGWETAAFVASFPLARRFGLARGFDVYRDAGKVAGDPTGSFYAERPANAVRAETMQWLDQRDSPSPVFLWVHYFDPHAPYQPHPPVYRGDPRRAYAGEVNFVDREAGRLFRNLGDRFASVRICMTSDHGEGLEDHGEFTHGVFVYDSTMRVPLILAGPGVSAGALPAEPASLVRVAPTLVDWVNLEADPEHFQEDPLPRNIASVAPDPAPIYLETLFTELRLGWAPLRGLRTRRWKVIHAPDPEIYDLAEDPGELNNLYSSEAARDNVAYLLTDVRDARWDARPLEPSEVDEQTAALLESLGYIGTADESDVNDFELPDPKSRIAISQHVSQAIVETAAGNLGLARAALSRAFAMDERHKEANIALARLEARSGNGTRALAIFKFCLTLPPRALDEEVEWELGNIAVQAGDFAKAEQHFDNSVALNPLNANSMFNWGLAAFVLQKSGAARDRWTEVLRLDPDHQQAVEWLAKLDGGPKN